MHKRNLFKATLLALGGVAIATAAAAQDFPPKKPVTLVVGFAAGGGIPALPANLPLLKGAALVGVFWGSFAQRQPQDNAANFQQLFAWHAEGKLKPLVSQTFPLARGGEAIDALGQRKAVGKVVVQVKA